MKVNPGPVGSLYQRQPINLPKIRCSGKAKEPHALALQPSFAIRDIRKSW